MLVVRSCLFDSSLFAAALHFWRLLLSREFKVVASDWASSLYAGQTKQNSGVETPVNAEMGV